VIDSTRMTEQFWIIIAVGAVLVVLLALFMGRKLKISWGRGSVETDAEAGVNQSVTATGKGSSAKKIRQESTGGAGKQDVSAEAGGTVQDVRQQQKRPR
jgi:hypothetical protein